MHLKKHKGMTFDGTQAPIEKVLGKIVSSQGSPFPIYQKLPDGKENILHIRILVTVVIACFAVIETAPAALKVGLIYDVTGRGDLSFCDAAYAGAKKAEDEFGFKLTEVTPSQSTDTELTLRRLAKLKYDLIIGVGTSVSTF